MITIPQVFILTGTPGTGKSTVSRIFSERLDAKHVELSQFSKEHGLIIEEDEERDTSVVDIDALKEAIASMITTSPKPLVIDGHYAHELVEPNSVSKVIILRHKPWHLRNVLEHRLYHSEKVWENVEAEIMGVITNESIELFSEEKLVEVETSGKTPDETVDEIVAIIEGDKPEFLPIDWVSYPETLRLLLSRPCTLS